MKRNNKVIIAALLLIIIICGVTLAHLALKNSNTLEPDYASGEVDTNAIKEEAKTSKEGKNGGGSVNLKFSSVVEVDLNKKTAKLYFKNPGTSSEDIALNLIIRKSDGDIILGTSEMIPPGYAIYKMNLNDISMLTKGGYDGILKTIYYNNKTKAKEIVDSEIKVTIEVK